MATRVSLSSQIDISNALYAKTIVAASFTQTIVTGAMLIAPFIAHVLFKPRFWLAAAFAFAVVSTLNLLLSISTEPFLITLRSSFIAGALTFAFAMPVGLFFRRIFWREYLAQEERNTHSKNFVLRSRIVGLIATIFGCSLLILIWSDGAPYPSEATLGGFMFVVLGIWYMISKKGGATHAQWLRDGKITDGEASNISPTERP
jgi:hypothetical protein